MTSTETSTENFYGYEENTHLPGRHPSQLSDWSYTAQDPRKIGMALVLKRHRQWQKHGEKSDTHVFLIEYD